MSDAAAQQPKRHRLEVRVTPAQDALIRQAADLEHATVTSFVLETVTARAATVMQQSRDVTLSNESSDRFMVELDIPVAPVEQLTDLFQRHPKLPET